MMSTTAASYGVVATSASASSPSRATSTAKLCWCRPPATKEAIFGSSSTTMIRTSIAYGIAGPASMLQCKPPSMPPERGLKLRATLTEVGHRW